MALSYAGVTLPVPTQEAISWVEANLSLRDVLEFSRLQWPSFGLSYLAFPGSLPDRPIQVGRLWWPRGASRWAMGHWLVDDNTLAQIRQNTESSTYTAQPLVMTWVNARTQVEVARISPSLFMLPARPLSQIAGFNGLNLLTLVDDRFFWWQRSTGNLTVTEGTTSWTDLYALLGTVLGVTIAVDAVPAAYLKPSFFLGLPYAYTPVLLDAVAYNVGQRITRGLDGNVRARNPINAAGDLAANRVLATAAFKQAGGVFNFDPASLPNDDPGLLPTSVTVTFPQVNADSGTNVGTGGVLPEVVTLASLALTDIPATTLTSGGSKVFHDTAPAQYLATVLQNNAELLALAQQAATDWYRFQLSPLDVKLAGIVPWNPEALSDSVEWSYAAYAGAQGEGDCCTRIQRTTFNDLTQELQHGGGAGGQSREPPCCGPPNPPTGSDGLILPIVIPPVDGGPISGGGVVPLPPNTGKLSFQASSTTMIRGFTPHVSGQILIVWNHGNGQVVLANDAAGVDGIRTPLQADYSLWPGDGVILEYDGLTYKRWAFDVPTIRADGVYATRDLQPGAGIVFTPGGQGKVTISAAGAAAGTAPDIHGWHQIDNWYGWFLGSIISAAAGLDPAFYYVCPFLTTQRISLSMIGIQAGNNDAVTHFIRLAIYRNTSPLVLYPSTLLFDSGAIQVNPSGGALNPIQTVCGATLDPSLYWLVLSGDNLNIGYQAELIPSATSTLIYGLLGAPTLSNAIRGGYSIGGQAFGAFPANFPAGATTTVSPPFIMVQIGNIAAIALRGAAFGNVIAQMPFEEGPGAVLQG